MDPMDNPTDDKTPEKNKSSSCVCCDRPETSDDCVQCDQCDGWWHMSCAEVTASVADRPWTCAHCLPLSVCSRTTVSSAKAARLSLKMKLLEEQQAMEKRHLVEKYAILEAEQNEMDEMASNRSRVSRRTSLERVKQWKQQCTDQGEGAYGLPPVGKSADFTAASLNQNSRIPKDSERSNSYQHATANINMPTSEKPATDTTVQQGRQHHGFSFYKPPLNSTVKPFNLQSLSKREQQQYTGAFPKSTLVQHEVVNTRGNVEPQVPPVAREGKPLCDPIINPPVPSKFEHSLQQIIKQFGTMASTATIPSLGANVFPIETKPVPLSGTNVGLPPPANPIIHGFVPPPAGTPISGPSLINPVLSIGTVPPPLGLPIIDQFTPSPSQLSARQVMPRDLPTFSGNPADWPIFISTFMNSSLACGYNSAENLARLQRCLKGPAYESVKSRLLLPESVPHVIDTLRLLYGRPELLISALLQKVRSVPAPKAERLETVIDFGIAVRSLCDHLEAAGQQDHLSNPTLLMELVGKLPAHTKMQWADHIQQHAVVNLKVFGDFMLRVVTAVSRVTMYVGEDGGYQQKPRQKGAVNTHTSEAESFQETVREKERVCACCKKPGHRVSACSAFKAYTVDNRWKFAQNNGLCRSCLNAHGRRSCRNATRCVIEGCQYRHHPLLHSDRVNSISRPTQGSSTVQNHMHRQSKQALLFRIIPVAISGPRATIETFAFLDDGSDLSLIENDLVEQLGIDGRTTPLCLKWTGNVTRVESDSKQVRITIRGASSAKQFTIDDIRTVKELTLPEQSLDCGELAQRYRYLQGLPIVSYANAVPRLLIGVNNVNLTVPLQVKEGKKSDPVAVKTRLGWCIFGGSGKEGTHSLNYHACKCASDQDLHIAVKEYFSMEDAGMKPSIVLESDEDKRARSIMEQSTRRVGDQFETGLLWRYDDIELPDSYNMAFKRFECLERKMMRDPELAANLKNQIAEYQQKGYAHCATKAELERADPKRAWYLPLGAVTNPRKPGKVRLVWDAAAKVDGISLNSMLLKGPDQLTSLPAVLSRFRQYKVGVSADIREMFHQLLIREPDRHSQRFLFRNDPTKPVETYIMDVATFGSTCSPASAQYVKNKNAEEFSDRFPRAVEGILKSHYVDDYLDSFENDEEAERVSREIATIHQKGGFHLRTWVSNSAGVLRGLKEASANPSKSLCLNAADRGDRVLGMLWQTSEDELLFSMEIKEEIQLVIDNGKRPTKRQMLKCLMGVFDPLGLLSVSLVHGKILLQDVWRAGLQWNEQVTEEIFDRWVRWTGLFPKIRGLRIPRCYFKEANVQVYDHLQLHVFVDATYFRVINTEGKAECSIVAAKTKVAPLKPLSIPRMELQAAVLGSRLVSFVQENHSVKVKQRFLWSDSATVLAWLRADHRRYTQYVACRVGEILTTTDLSEWHWVPSKLNPADAATKWGKNPCPEATDEWFKGPEFLRLAEENWPKQPKPSKVPEEELRPCFLIQGSTIPEVVIDFSRFSRCRCRGETPELLHLTQEELKKAKNTLVWIAQWQEYPDEMVAVSRGQAELPKSSSLYQLTPTVDECGVLRVGGRIGAAPHTSFDARFPVILPRKHPVTTLIVDDFHRTFRHGNSETVVNEIRQFYSIFQLRRVVKQAATVCQWCKVKKATPKVPRMAPLPLARLSSFTRPFTYTGIDFFRPLLVKVGRSSVKRWICLFTCLTTRAVHVEVAHSLSTPSCIKCIRRFICRRGAPVEIYSDNGTNFQGAERLLRKELENVHGELAATFTNASTKWVFIPPAAPHMGGAWERMVRSIKSAMEAAYNNDRKLDDEGLVTLAVEAEGIVNSRPLTYLPLDAAEVEALTPNHFLLGSSTGVRQPAVPFSDPVSAVKNSWNQIQRQLDVFWKRWIREYLPMLTKRMKWFGEVKPVAVGDLVLIADEVRRNGWTRGKIKDVVIAEDGRVRQAIVQTARGILRRPVSKLAVLEVELDGKTGTSGQCYGGENVTANTALGGVTVAEQYCHTVETSSVDNDVTRRREESCHSQKSAESASTDEIHVDFKAIVVRDRKL
ncbi:uncharacterized protein LOC131680146 [Topomyia yanbarensis]|uniref:uncharacterized protein LOC131680146 n=1 Tax=Topomyia yanbarensis TaxID=2498891 RepID=UPI00273C0F82|nr:uncharacterized protein LOC131680146 [Topomyia yanbarensis]